ncbi:hypothetical protein A3709_19505 [Halioglobus sp. HI00S01]|uniref:hypothetical protein n=1 Tax=Halioglobus sp. HI00S01 TaxID=1822214 RepID=UPI0007C38E2D|nr:hypothetical protein [Halioglobus sp. HI00S01]KZX57812.1 hypothetical protein A3709_19505 [Halioglobus sp. HI00S01]
MHSPVSEADVVAYVNDENTYMMPIQVHQWRRLPVMYYAGTGEIIGLYNTATQADEAAASYFRKHDRDFLQAKEAGKEAEFNYRSVKVGDVFILPGTDPKSLVGQDVREVTQHHDDVVTGKIAAPLVANTHPFTVTDTVLPGHQPHPLTPNRVTVIPSNVQRSSRC